MTILIDRWMDEWIDSIDRCLDEWVNGFKFTTLTQHNNDTHYADCLMICCRRDGVV